jgi:hypothetical protein
MALPGLASENITENNIFSDRAATWNDHPLLEYKIGRQSMHQRHAR